MSTDLALQGQHILRPGQMTTEQVELLKTTICKDATDVELDFFLQVCRSKGLDPFTRQIHAVKRWNPATQKKEMAIQIGIDGFRLQAERSGLYKGQDGPYWCDHEGNWTDVWLKSGPPFAAKVGVYRDGFDKPLYRVVMYSEYVQTKEGNVPNAMWAKMPASQLAKCAEAVACRAAFPQELSGFYAPEEMDQADIQSEPRPATMQPAIEAAPDKPWTTYKGMLAAFDAMKERGGEDLYYKVLRSHGCEHANKFSSTDDAVKCYRELSAVVARAEAAKTVDVKAEDPK